MRFKDDTPPIDQSKAKLIAYGIVAAFFALMLVMGLRSSGGPQTFQGDVVESRACLACQGTGENEGERCRSCLGAKKLKVVVPGPNHPVQIRGTVRDLSAFESLEKAQEQAAVDAKSRKLSLKPVQGAVREATISITGPEATIDLEPNATGKFKSLLKPQKYKVVVTAPGFAIEELTVEIPPLTQPVWPNLPGAKSMTEGESFQLDIFMKPG